MHRCETRIADWDPEDETFWESKGKAIAHSLRTNFLAQLAPTSLAQARV